MANPKPRPRTNEGKAHRTRCPVCEAQVESRDLTADKHFPFCRRRCKLIDLGKWFAGGYSFSRDAQGEDEMESEGEDE